MKRWGGWEETSSLNWGVIWWNFWWMLEWGSTRGCWTIWPHVFLHWGTLLLLPLKNKKLPGLLPEWRLKTVCAHHLHFSVVPAVQCGMLLVLSTLSFIFLQFLNGLQVRNGRARNARYGMEKLIEEHLPSSLKDFLLYESSSWPIFINLIPVQHTATFIDFSAVCLSPVTRYCRNNCRTHCRDGTKQSTNFQN